MVHLALEYSASGAADDIQKTTAKTTRRPHWQIVNKDSHFILECEQSYNKQTDEIVYTAIWERAKKTLMSMVRFKCLCVRLACRYLNKQLHIASACSNCVCCVHATWVLTVGFCWNMTTQPAIHLQCHYLCTYYSGLPLHTSVCMHAKRIIMTLFLWVII